MKVHTVAALLVGLLLFASQKVPGHAMEMKEIIEMAPEIMSMGMEAVFTCMKENKVNFVTTIASLMTSKVLDQNAKCAICCLTSKIFITEGDNCSVNTAVINMIVEPVPDPMKGFLQKVLPKCEKEGAGNSKCQGLFDYGRCIFKEGKKNMMDLLKMG